jgi:hypothetical protein
MLGAIAGIVVVLGIGILIAHSLDALRSRSSSTESQSTRDSGGVG